MSKNKDKMPNINAFKKPLIRYDFIRFLVLFFVKFLELENDVSEY